MTSSHAPQHLAVCINRTILSLLFCYQGGLNRTVQSALLHTQPQLHPTHAPQHQAPAPPSPHSDAAAWIARLHHLPSSSAASAVKPHYSHTTPSADSPDLPTQCRSSVGRHVAVVDQRCHRLRLLPQSNLLTHTASGASPSLPTNRRSGMRSQAASISSTTAYCCIRSLPAGSSRIKADFSRTTASGGSPSLPTHCRSGVDS